MRCGADSDCSCTELSMRRHRPKLVICTSARPGRLPFSDQIPWLVRHIEYASTTTGDRAAFQAYASLPKLITKLEGWPTVTPPGFTLISEIHGLILGRPIHTVSTLRRQAHVPPWISRGASRQAVIWSHPNISLGSSLISTRVSASEPVVTFTPRLGISQASSPSWTVISGRCWPRRGGGGGFLSGGGSIRHIHDLEA